MFTGLVEEVGTLRRAAGGSRGSVRALVRSRLAPLVLGESIAVNGACLTVDRIVDGGFEADMSSETLEKTTLGGLRDGARVHLERAVPLGGRMGGHMVLGHVDGVGSVRALDRLGDTVRMGVAAPAGIARFVAPKGSITLDGVSLTVNDLRDGAGEVVFDVMLVPHTLERTALADLRVGSALNVEVDVLARYVARQLESPRGEQGSSTDDDRDRRLLAKLHESGFV